MFCIRFLSKEDGRGIQQISQFTFKIYIHKDVKLKKNTQELNIFILLKLYKQQTTKQFKC